MRILLAALLLPPSLAWPTQKKGPPAPAGKKAPPPVDWRAGSWESILAEAAARNAPIVLVFLPLEEVRLARVRDGLYRSPLFLGPASRCICVAAVDAEHPVPKGGNASRCPHFPTIACADHVQIARALFKRFAKDGGILAPLHVFFDPDGKERDRVENSKLQGEEEGVRDQQIVKATERAVAAAGPALDRALYVRFSEELTKAELALERYELASPRALFREVAEAVKTGPFLARARAGLEEVEKRAPTLLAWAAKREAEGDLGAAYDAYLEVERAVPGTPKEKEAKEARARLEESPQTRDAIDAHRREKEAAGLLREARALAEKGEVPKAAKLLERIVRDFAGTPSADAAAKDLRGLPGKRGPGR
ncbi:MAG TPA: hypothetical protein VFI25_16940 [Planctomycetota bacterium]|nr:hypothetical protein [Planctomycetota bacterium]